MYIDYTVETYGNSYFSIYNYRYHYSFSWKNFVLTDMNLRCDPTVFWYALKLWAMHAKPNWFWLGTSKLCTRIHIRVYTHTHTIYIYIYGN